MKLIAFKSIFTLVIPFAGICQNTFPSSGNVGIGTSTPGVLLDIGSATKSSIAIPNSSIYGFQSKTTSSLTSSFSTGGSIYHEQTVATTGNLQGLNVYTVTSNGTGTVTLAIGIASNHEHKGAGTVNTVRSFQGGGNFTGSGTISSWTSFFSTFAVTGTGTVTNGYGLYVANFPTAVTNKFGVYVQDPNATNYFAGKVTIGTGVTSTPTGYNLYVSSGILTEKIKAALTTSSNWADNVFGKKYQLQSLENVEIYIQKNNHLPDVPSADDLVKAGGIDMIEMFATQMKKIEELTLYIIEQNKEIKLLKGRLTELEK